MTTETVDVPEVRTAVEQWMLTAVVPVLAERGMLPPEHAAAIASVASPNTPPEQRRAIADELRATVQPWQDRRQTLAWLLASILDPRWTLDAPVSLTDMLISRLGLRQVVALARADEVVLSAMVADHPRIAAMVDLEKWLALVRDEITGSEGWSPEVQRLAWAAAQAADSAGLPVTIDTHPDGLRLLIVDGDEVLLDAPYRAGIDQDGCRVRDLDLRPVVAELLALDAALPHDRDAVWPVGASERREALYARAWHMARAAGWQVGVDHDPTDPERPVVAVIVLPSGVQMRGHVRHGSIPEDGIDVIPWDGQPRDVAAIAAWLVATV